MRRVVSNILSFSIIARSLSTLDTMRDIVEKKCTGHGPSSNIASFWNWILRSVRGIFRPKINGIRDSQTHYTQSTGTQNFQVSQCSGINWGFNLPFLLFLFVCFLFLSVLFINCLSCLFIAVEGKQNFTTRATRLKRLKRATRRVNTVVLGSGRQGKHRKRPNQTFSRGWRQKLRGCAYTGQSNALL